MLCVTRKQYTRWKTVNFYLQTSYVILTFLFVKIFKVHILVIDIAIYLLRKSLNHRNVIYTVIIIEIEYKTQNLELFLCTFSSKTTLFDVKMRFLSIYATLSAHSAFISHPIVTKLCSLERKFNFLHFCRLTRQNNKRWSQRYALRPRVLGTYIQRHYKFK